MVEHIVLFKFSEGTQKDQKDEAIHKIKNLKHEIPGILDLQSNYNFSTSNQGFEIGLTVRLETKEALEAYGPHPKHQALVAYLKEIGLTDLIIVDFEI
ncbi:Dabb family protein [Aneurinibacillus sp. Ricciae_BoGa-3]|uniref:Dabb family protein n=1 Tax=Aneurinibacillus sp. Ricciae_BoGa-3 TaxID=3022697 RepID=UPI0023409C16|nr:Dabb family protein [Aneurinibacillus sp. Ricciae_BoGa-3]WCK52990.1 Dabb family protein [Aneurinibacillus sp. Ricciae_BoGa-3]